MRKFHSHIDMSVGNVSRVTLPDSFVHGAGLDEGPEGGVVLKCGVGAAVRSSEGSGVIKLATSVSSVCVGARVAGIASEVV